MELDDLSIEFQPVHDRRPLIPLPLPVKLVAVSDVNLQSAAGLETQLDQFYSTMLLMAREPWDGVALTYRAENFRLVIGVVEPPVLRDDLRPIGIEVPSLLGLEHKLVESEIEYERIRGLIAGEDALLVQDPAGNWVAISEFREVR